LTSQELRARLAALLVESPELIAGLVEEMQDYAAASQVEGFRHLLEQNGLGAFWPRETTEAP